MNNAVRDTFLDAHIIYVFTYLFISDDGENAINYTQSIFVSVIIQTSEELLAPLQMYVIDVPTHQLHSQDDIYIYIRKV